MGACLSFLTSIYQWKSKIKDFKTKSWDDIFSYKTKKYLIVRDRRLGMLHWGFIFLALIYIIISITFIDKPYLKNETPVGTVRATIIPPLLNKTAFARQPFSKFRYCNENNPSTQFSTVLPCINLNGNDVNYPEGTQQLLSTTRLTQEFYQIPPNCTFGQCEYQFLNSSSYFVAGIEDYTIRIVHSVQSPNFPLFHATSSQLAGQLIDNKGNVLQKFHPNNDDIIPLGVLLDSIGLKLDDDSIVNSSQETVRYDGQVVVFFIQYTNTLSTTDPSMINFTFHLFPLPEEYKIEQPIYYGASDPLSNLLILNRHGIQFLFFIAGNFGHFNFLSFLISITVYVGLTAVSSSIVDAILVHFIKERDIYMKQRVSKTDRWSDIQDSSSTIRRSFVLGYSYDSNSFDNNEYEPPTTSISMS